MKNAFIKISFSLLLVLIILPVTNTYGQEPEADSYVGKLSTLIDLLYTVENFQARLGHALENNQMFAQNVENEAFIQELTASIAATALDHYGATIGEELSVLLTEPQVDSLLNLLSSPTGKLLINLFEIDNQVVEFELALYAQKVVEEAYNKTAGQANSPYEEVVKNFQTALNDGYLEAETSPLSAEQRKTFEEIGGHAFFDIDPRYKVEADLEVFPEPESIQMNTSNSKLQDYNVYGKATFMLDGREFELFIYQSQRLMKTEIYKNHLFLPFTDLTSGEETYGGGRYIDLEIPQDKSSIIIDFNQAYQPYCAYSSGYSCPIPPVENFINAKIEAGVKNINLE